MTLDLIPNGSSCEVISIEGKDAIKRRIMDMGVTKGTKVSVVKRAPLGDPIELNVRGYQLLLRAADAQRIVVK